MRSTNTCVLIATEPRSYREALGLAIQAQRPLIDVRIIDPGQLVDELGRCCAALVVCSDLSPVVEQQAAAWILLYPEGTSQAVISGSEPTVIGELDLPGMLALVDRAVDAVPH